MKQEIERKFLVKGDGWRADAGDGVGCRQGYLSFRADGATVRVRLLGERGFLTIKGPAEGISRPEFEYEIDSEDVRFMLDNLCGRRVVSKMRYTFTENGMQWEVDVFSGANQGLIIAEIELQNEKQSFEKPEWLGEEVSLDRRYTNAALAEKPYRNWKI